MQQSPPGSTSFVPTVEATRQWLATRIAAALELNPREVERNAQLAHLGISSVLALAITHDLEELVGRKLSVTAMWEPLGYSRTEQPMLAPSDGARSPQR